METILIENFLSIKRVEIQVMPFTVLIGPQASGKSIVTKLLHFCKNIHSILNDEMVNLTGRTSLQESLSRRLKSYLNVDHSINKKFFVDYKSDDLRIQIVYSKTNLFRFEFSKELTRSLAYYKMTYKRIQTKAHDNVIELSDDYKKRSDFSDRLTNRIRHDLTENYGYYQVYIPAGRSFFSNLQNNIFSFLSSSNAIDYFLQEYGQFYETLKSFTHRNLNKKLKHVDLVNRQMALILKGKYLLEKEKVFIQTDAGKIQIANCSSGQQEILPLLLMVSTLPLGTYAGGGSTIYIEEPEAHLFPESQKHVVDLICFAHQNSLSKSQIFITTHSPYILTAINLNILAFMVGADEAENHFKQNPKEVTAYSIVDGVSSRIYDDETSMISADLIDEVSNIMNHSFSERLRKLK